MGRSLVRIEYDGKGGLFWRPREMIPAGDFGRSWRPKTDHHISTSGGRGWRPVRQDLITGAPGRSWRPRDVSAMLSEGAGRYWRPKPSNLNSDKFLASEKTQ